MALPLALLGASALAGGLSSWLGRPKQRQIQRFTPEQQKYLNQAAQMAMQGLQNPYAGFEPIAQQAERQFQTQTVPSLAERFTAFGGQGGQRSSAFQEALGNAGSQLGTDLAALKSQYGLARQSQLQQLLGLGLTPQFDVGIEPASGLRGFASGALGGLSGSLGGLGTAGLMNQWFNPVQSAQPMQPNAPIQIQPQENARQTVESLMESMNPGQANLQKALSTNRFQNPVSVTPNQGQANFEQFLRGNQFQTPLTSRYFNPAFRSY